MKKLTLSLFIFFLSISYSSTNISMPVNNKSIVTDDFLTQINSNYVTNKNLGFNFNNYNPRNMNASLIDSSCNGYGLYESNTRPIDHFDLEYWIVTYRQFAGFGTTHGQLGAASIENFPSNNNWTIHDNVNANGNPPWGGGGICEDGTCAQARYPSAVASENAPYIFWNEYTAENSTYGGRPYYTYDENGFTYDEFAYPIDIDSDWGNLNEAKDQWVGSVDFVLDTDTNISYINSVYVDWSRNNNFYLFHSATEGLNETGNPILNFNEEQLLAINPTSESGNNPYISINDSGKGVFGFFNSLNLADNLNPSIQLKITNDFGQNWSDDLIFVPENVLSNIFSTYVSNFLTDMNNDGINESYIEYCKNYETNQIDYDNDGIIEEEEVADIYTITGFDIKSNGDIRIDSDNNIHILFSYVPVAESDYVLIDNVAGFYHLMINIDYINNPGDINTSTGWNWSFLIDGSKTWKNDVTNYDYHSGFKSTHANLSFASDNSNVIWAAVNMANVGDFVSSDVEENVMSCNSWEQNLDNASNYDNWSMDIYILKSFNGGKDWSLPKNASESNGSLVDGIYNGPEEMFPHTPTYSTSQNVFFMYQMPDWENNEIGDFNPWDYFNRVYIGYAGENLIFENGCDYGLSPDDCGICGGDNSSCTGCMDVNAVNYDSNAIINSDCIYANDISPHYNPSWEGVPNNPMAIYLYSVNIDNISWSPGDEIGVFDGNICVGNIIYNPEFNSPFTILTSENNNNTNVQDGFISGNNISFKFWDYSTQTEIINLSSTSNDNTFIPFGSISTDLYAIFGCMDIIACNYNPDATNEDFCIYIPEGQCDCEGNVLDECNICGGEGPLDNFDCDGNCIVDLDCNGDCGGSASLDECGICDGEGPPDGYCDCEENVLDQCQVCAGDNSTCSGCTDQYAINYNSEATIDDNSCEYPELGDLNNDNLFNIIDIVLMVNFILNGEYVFYADLNDDGFLNILDILLFVNWILD